MRTALLWTMALGLGLTMTTSSLARPASAERVEHAPLVWTEDDSDDGMADMSDVLEQDDRRYAEEDTGALDGRVQQGVPVTSCPTDFRNIAGRLCIHTSPQGAVPFIDAAMRCTLEKGRVASHGYLFFVYTQTPGFSASYNPLGRWMSPELVGDDQALCGDRAVTSSGDSDITDFEGICHKSERRAYWCVRELE